MNKKRFIGSNVLYLLLCITVVWGFFSLATGGSTSSGQNAITTTELFEQLQKNNVKSIKTQPVDDAVEVTGELKESIDVKAVETGIFTNFLGSGQSKVKKFKLYISNSEYMKETIEKLSLEKGVEVKAEQRDQSGIWISVLANLIPTAVLIFFMFSMMGNMGGAGGRNPMSFGKLRPEDTQGKPSKVRFTDVAGAEEEKQELLEIVEFLKDPRKFTALGARIPSGVLLEGPPGTGKTLLAKAVAGEANVPFHSISGSEFVEMFVGVGASRVRDLFEKAKKSAPAIIFIDEIDAVGRRRGAGMGGGNDEREQTLNQMLVEMDGFEGNEGVIVIAATNRSDVLDPALLRPGRFDRKILVGNPDVKAREEILAVHARKKPMAKDVHLKDIAEKTPGFSGADLANLLNEAALIAARLNKKMIDAEDIDEAQDRIIAGLAKRDRVRTEKANRVVAYHEAGHAIAGLVLASAQDVHKVTIVPRGRAAGYVISVPKEDQVVYSREELFHRVVGLLAGRAAEELIFNESSTGASNDIEQASQIVRSMVMVYGMSDKLGMVDYKLDNNGFMTNRHYSDNTASAIDKEVIDIMNQAKQKARHILEKHKTQLDLIAEKLIELETIDGRAIKTLFETGKMPEEVDYPSEKVVEETSEENIKEQEA
ncbi:ATP-dependent zinc metalloprotease FtsH [Granulicatella sp. zg-ZJ]|uniref:ATP-dependent zinc metalloprotease FtsH n=1 Tax=unclassified Granulicatella TaxID=2630493 RepID=UPI0013C0AA9E|nr:MULTISPECIES: ATP-dependent zinc metalloprotease FtsH [unclassified Granulicatella]NEW63313.1 ATP-dependent zinc metalloprotease FtsH [Granulicatella sp. zg-ZJ]NEW66264.1 ATP-dependent zinc metalloprotease FtsH [Granulicatella sp. zg-84]QMI85647.1 ATP-dependent zinc metalloprotease FtsH [Carnobacteriaceae bacterium zg-84]